eukprot:jgi/Ulvmu1/3297/UM153_0009.1
MPSEVRLSRQPTGMFTSEGATGASAGAELPYSDANADLDLEATELTVVLEESFEGPRRQDCANISSHADRSSAAAVSSGQQAVGAQATPFAPGNCNAASFQPPLAIDHVIDMFNTFIAGRGPVQESVFGSVSQKLFCVARSRL